MESQPKIYPNYVHNFEFGSSFMENSAMKKFIGQKLNDKEIVLDAQRLVENLPFDKNDAVIVFSKSRKSYLFGELENGKFMGVMAEFDENIFSDYIFITHKCNLPKK